VEYLKVKSERKLEESGVKHIGRAVASETGELCCKLLLQ